MGKPRRSKAARIQEEKFLRHYIYQNPQSIPFYDEDIRFLPLAEEFRVDGERIDILGVDEEGEVYVVETKLYRNPDKREVVGQVLDYGAALGRSYQDFGTFTRAIDDKLRSNLGLSLAQHVQKWLSLGDAEVTELIEKDMKVSFEQRKFRFVVVMDSLDKRLPDLIKFMEQNTKFVIFAVGMAFYEYEGLEIMVPTLYGTPPAARGSRTAWNEGRFVEKVGQKLEGSELAAVKKLYEFSQKVANEVAWGSGSKAGSYNPKFSQISMRSLYSVDSKGTLRLNFGWLNESVTAEEYRDEFKRRVERLRGFTIPDDYRERWIRVQPATWCPVVDEFIAVVEGLVSKARQQSDV